MVFKLNITYLTFSYQKYDLDELLKVCKFESHIYILLENIVLEKARFNRYRSCISIKSSFKTIVYPDIEVKEN